jgi:hypothetical protein
LQGCHNPKTANPPRNEGAAPLGHFFSGLLERPDNEQHPSRKLDPKSLSCCGAGDTVQTKFKVENAGGQYPEDTWYAWLKDSWVRIPPEKIVKDFSPNGQPYLFLLADTIQCFVPPKGGL